MDFFAIASYGVYPTPTPTGTLRAALGVSYGLLNFALPTGVATSSILNGVLKICDSIGFRMLRIGG